MMTPLEAAKEAVANFPGESDRRWVLDAIVTGLMVGYDSRWSTAHKSIELLGSEETIDSDLINIDTLKESRTFKLTGIIDKLANQDGLVIYDHKTTSAAIDDPNDVYWRQLAIEAQPSFYDILCRQNGRKVDRIIWDVVRKPGIRPKKLAKKEQAEVASLRKYCGQPVSEETSRLVVSEPTENGELFQIRVASEALVDPNRYFQRRSATRTNEEIYSYAQELWQIGQDILNTQNANRWYRNSGACMNYNTPCEFLGLCSGFDDPNSDRWIHRDQSEVDVDDSRQTLSHSRIRTFQTCRRKFYYKYQLGIERADEEERESLFFGSLFHAALDAWWVAISKG